jgi:hypothetical protein
VNLGILKFLHQNPTSTLDNKGVKMNILASLFVFILVSCGKEETLKEKSQTSNNLSQSYGVLIIPAPDVVGGGTSIKYGNSDYYLGKMSQEATQYFIALKSGNIFVPPIYQDRSSTHYRINFIGSPTKGPCSFNPTAQCSVINVESMKAY